MVSVGLGFVLGVLCVQQSTSLLPLPVYAGSLLLVGAIMMRVSRWRVCLCLLAGLLIGAGYATGRAHIRLEARVPDALDRTTVTWQGTVTGLPERAEGGVRFVFEPDAASVGKGSIGPLALSWYPESGLDESIVLVRPGARFSLTIRLRQATSLFNPGGFDHAGWYLAKGIAGLGYVKNGVLIATSAPSVDATRDRLRTWIEGEISPPVAGPLLAMALGDQSRISDAQWDTFRVTGTAHLVAISGLHVGIVAGLIAACVGGIWRRVPWLVCRVPARHAAVCCAVVAALAYAALAGFGIPVVRAVIMLSVAAVALIGGRQSAPFRVLLLAMVAVLLFDPWAVLSAGFWLSFSAVAALMLVLSGRLARQPRWRQFLLAQAAISWMSLPIVLGVFGAPSLISPLANALAIPVVSIVLVPALLLAVVSGSSSLLGVAAWVLEHLMTALNAMAGWPIELSWTSPPLSLVMITCAALVISLLPRGTPMRRVAALCVLPLMLWRPVGPSPGVVWATVIDVGQGLSVLVRTARHSLLYDTGRAYYRGGDAGRSVVLPALAKAGIHQLDMLVLSHDDNDHVGGAESVMSGVRVQQVVGGAGVELKDRTVDPCVAGVSWRWDGVAFDWLYPDHGPAAAADNDRSCVLRIRASGHALLLTGDITRDAEARLISDTDLSDVWAVVAPHHGSKSSSSPAFVNALNAEHVIFSAGYKNPYHHPARVVVERWEAHGTRSWNTATVGAVTTALGEGSPHIEGRVTDGRRYWHRH